MYIVGEYLFLENFLINYLILQSTKTITRTKATKKRILLTAMLAGLYPFVMFFPSIIFLSNFYIKILISIFIVKIAFNAKTLALYIKQLFSFYIISFIFAGASIGFYYFINNYPSNLTKSFNLLHGFPIKYLILGVVVGMIMTKNILNYYHGKKLKEDQLVQVLISLKDKTTSLTALIDTGNSLIEPMSKLPVFVVEYPIVKNLLPNELEDIYENGSLSFSSLDSVMMELKDNIKLYLIPFKSIGSNSGILIGFKPDYILVSSESGVNVYEDLLIGIFNNELSLDEQYRGLLNLEILKGGNYYVEESKD